MIRALVFWILLSLPAYATPPSEVARALLSPVLSGSADVRFLGFNLYRAELWRAETTFALVLTYKRSFSAEELAVASVKEIARMERSNVNSYPGLEALLKGCFANVKSGDRITGISTSSQSASFFFNGNKSCDITYAKFRDRFFGIWLGDRTRDPKSRDRLLGKS